MAIEARTDRDALPLFAEKSIFFIVLQPPIGGHDRLSLMYKGRASLARP